MMNSVSKTSLLSKLMMLIDDNSLSFQIPAETHLKRTVIDRGESDQPNSQEGNIAHMRWNAEGFQFGAFHFCYN